MITIFNLQVNKPIHADVIPEDKEYVVVGPLTHKVMSHTMMLGFVRSLLHEAEQTPKFDHHAPVHIVSDSTVQSLCMIIAIRAAFARNTVSIWFTTDTELVFVNINDFTIEGEEFGRYLYRFELQQQIEDFETELSNRTHITQGV